MDSLAQGTKYDGGKIRYDLIAPEATKGLAQVLTFGANKYAARNWEKGILYSRVLRAIKGHILEWELHGKADDETGYSHLHHAAAGLMFLATYEARGMVEFDDMPGHKPKPTSVKELEEQFPQIFVNAQGNLALAGLDKEYIAAPMDNPKEDWSGKSMATAARFGVKENNEGLE